MNRSSRRSVYMAGGPYRLPEDTGATERCGSEHGSMSAGASAGRGQRDRGAAWYAVDGPCGDGGTEQFSGRPGLGLCRLSQRAQGDIQVGQLAVRNYRGRLRLLAELLALRVDQPRDMRVARCRVAEQPLEQQLPRGRVQQVGAAHDVGNALRLVIDDNR